LASVVGRRDFGDIVLVGILTSSGAQRIVGLP
jgi:hypothetical protein